jgi:hypothetical protein
MLKYQQGKIYTIRCLTDNTLIYVGSTTQPLYKRLADHKSYNKTETNRLIYKTINNDWDNWYIELHSLYPCSCKEELCRREGEIIREIGTLNMDIAGRTKKEWREDNILLVSVKDKEKYEKNKDKILEQKKEYYENNKDGVLKKNKNYRINNKDKILEHKKEYYENNKNKILKQHKEKIICECGCIITKCDIAKHRRTQKHNTLMLNITTNIT